MSEFNNRASNQEKALNVEEQQQVLWADHAWIERIIEARQIPGYDTRVTLVPSTPESVAKKHESGSLTIYTLDDDLLVEYSTFRSNYQRTSITHYLLNQNSDGVWSLETTGDLATRPEILSNEIEHRGYELTDQEERLDSKEPLYPELFKKATVAEITAFNELVEMAAFGGTSKYFAKIDEFLKDTALIQEDIIRLSDETGS